ncbi:MAG: RadC family protein [bacterium]
MAICDWAKEDRPREKLLSKGASALTDAELLAIFLRTGVKGISAVELAQQLLQDYHGLRDLLAADQARFCQGHGLGVAKYVQLQAVIEMSRRFLQEKLKRGDAMTSPEIVENYLQTRLRDYPYEVFACLFMDNRHRVIEYEELFRGTIDAASVYPREVVRRALAHNAAAVIFAHNHPSGIAEPSSADEHITQRLKDALDLIDVRVLDHFVVGDYVVSFAKRGLL